MTDQPLPIERFSHVAIGVSDVDRSVEFYRRFFGLDVVFDVELEGDALAAVSGVPDAKGRMVGGLVGGTVLELMSIAGQTEPKTREGAGVGYNCISLSVPDLDAAFAQAKALGAVPRNEPVDIGGVRMFFLVDPDGTEIEIIEYPGDARTSAELWRGRQD